MTQEALGAAVGVDRSTISKFETGKHWFQAATLMAVLNELKIDAADLFGRDPSDPSSCWTYAKALQQLPENMRQVIFSAIETAGSSLTPKK